MLPHDEQVYTTLHLFSGIGGDAEGMRQAATEWRGIRGRFHVLAGIDADPEACQDFTALTGAPAFCIDLFDRHQYKAFYGHEPPEDWCEAVPEDIRKACGDIPPDVLILSAPCKGMSTLLPNSKAQTQKYQTLNQLTLRGLWLSLEAFPDSPPMFILVENVAGIAKRGAAMLAQVESLLAHYGYVFDRRIHDCGQIGGLAQHRNRFLLLARHQKKVPWWARTPPVHRVRACGEVLEPLPMPDHPAGGPMHHLPRLKWRTWIRLALIPAGKDWRALEHVADKTRIVRAHFKNNYYRVVPFDQPVGTITSGHSPSCGAAVVADPRNRRWFDGAYRVLRMDRPADTITGGNAPSCGAMSIADCRVPRSAGRHFSHLRVARWSDPLHTITGATHVANGAPSVADVRLGYRPRKGSFRVLDWHKPSTTVIGSASVRGSNCAAAVADPRVYRRYRNDTLKVLRWSQPARAVTGSADVYNTAAAVADPRLPDWDDRLDPPPVIVSLDGNWHRPLTTYELAILQSFPTHLPDGRPFQLVGGSGARHRERIGNAIPPAAMTAIGKTLLKTLLAASHGTWYMSGEPLWAAPLTGIAAIVAELKRRKLARQVN